MRSMHFAVDNLDLSTIFPESLIFGTMNEHRTAVLRCLEELKRSELNKNQQDAVTSMLDPVCTKVGVVSTMWRWVLFLCQLHWLMESWLLSMCFPAGRHHKNFTMLYTQYYPSLQIPSLVLGPFGCGKTRTLSECIKLLALWVQDARILICTPDYGAANLYVEGLNREWKGGDTRGYRYESIVLGLKTKLNSTGVLEV